MKIGSRLDAFYMNTVRASFVGSRSSVEMQKDLRIFFKTMRAKTVSFIWGERELVSYSRLVPVLVVYDVCIISSGIGIQISWKQTDVAALEHSEVDFDDFEAAQLIAAVDTPA
jgi:hypothetical protein